MMKRFAALGLLFVLVAAALAGCGGSQSPKTKTDVQVVLSDFRIQSSVAAFSIGTPYHFVVANKGTTDHEFMIIAPMMSNMPMERMHDMSLAHIDHLAPGETKSLDFTFSQPVSPGRLEMACYLNGHYDAGMKQQISAK
jgi:uncharacterized cupredoxin-like copper-binding protein